MSSRWSSVGFGAPLGDLGEQQVVDGAGSGWRSSLDRVLATEALRDQRSRNLQPAATPVVEHFSASIAPQGVRAGPGR